MVPNYAAGTASSPLRPGIEPAITRRTGSAATSFRKIVETHNEDVWHLMNAVGSLRAMYGLLLTIILGALVLAVVGLGMVAFGLSGRG